MTAFGADFAARAALSEGAFVHFANISLRRRYFYMSTPKVASSSLLMTLQRAELCDTSFTHTPISNVHARALSPLLTPYQVGDFWDRRLPELVKFCIVRNPFDRVISAYLDKVEPAAGGLGPRMSALLGKAEPVGFEDFLEAIALEPPQARDPHYAVQYDHTAQALVSYDVIGRFEALPEAMDRISNAIGFDLSPFSARVDHHWTGEKDYGRFLTPANIERITTIYRNDFEAFGYSPRPA